MNSIGSFSNVLISFSVTRIIGIIIFYRISTTNGFKCYIVKSCFVEPDANLIAMLSAFDPTKNVFFYIKIFK